MTRLRDIGVREIGTRCTCAERVNTQKQYSYEHHLYLTNMTHTSNHELCDHTSLVIIVRVKIVCIDYRILKYRMTPNSLTLWSRRSGREMAGMRCLSTTYWLVIVQSICHKKCRVRKKLPTFLDKSLKGHEKSLTPDLWGSPLLPHCQNSTSFSNAFSSETMPFREKLYKQKNVQDITLYN